MRFAHASPPVLLHIAFAFASLALAAEPCSRGFVAPDRIVTWSGVSSAAYGDFDEDGRVDVVYTTASSIYVSLNRGSGVFEQVSSASLGFPFSFARLAAATDVDRDGHLDVLFGQTKLLGWARGRGDGSFETPVYVPLPSAEGSAMRLLDFDRDGLLDFIDFDVAGAGARFYRATTAGAFELAASVTFPAGNYELAKAVAGDFDGDGNVDALRIAFNPGTRQWQATLIAGALTATPAVVETILTFTRPEIIEPIDLDGDGREELVGISAGELAVLRFRDGDWTREAAMPLPQKSDAASLRPKMADVDADGRAELLFLYGSSVAIARSTGDGRFAEPLLLGVAGSGGFHLADIDGNGVADIATNAGQQGLSVIYGGSGISGRPPQVLLPLPFRPRFIRLVDLNHDGSQDVVASDGSTMTVSVLLNDGTGAFRLHSTLHLVSGQGGLRSLPLVADFDGDGHVDLAVEPEQPPVQPVIAFGDGTGTFTPVTMDFAGARLTATLRSSDAPGAALLAIQNGEVRALRVSRSGGPAAATLLPAPGQAKVRTLDLNGDGLDEIAVATPAKIEIFARTSGTWQTAFVLPLSSHGFDDVIAADLNGDHLDDVVLEYEDVVVPFLRNGSTFEAGRAFSTSGFLQDAAVADVDGDGSPDLVLGWRGNYDDPGGVQVLRNDGLGGFTPHNTSRTGPPYGFTLAVVDVDGDGAADVLMPTDDGVEIQRNVCTTPRVRVGPVPSRVSPGERVRIVVNLLATEFSSAGVMQVMLDGALAAHVQTSSLVWTTPPLEKGQHVVTIHYDDPYAGPSSAAVSLNVNDPQPRRRRARP